MTHNFTATQARNLSTTDQVIYNEIDFINRAILADALAGNLQTTVNDGTTMTESTPVVTVVSTGYADGWTPGGTLTIAGTTVTLSSGVNDGTNIDQATADINAAGVVGLVATNDGSEITLTYETPRTTWSLILAEDSGALGELGFTSGTFSAPAPESTEYYSVWSGQTEDRKKSFEFSEVVNHFQGLGYSILAKLNTESQTATFMWEVYW